MNHQRPPAVAGSFYPSDPDELNGLLDKCFESSSLTHQVNRAPSTTLIAGMVPHAGYYYSGSCAAHLYATLAQSIRRVVLLGVNHRARGHNAALSPWDSWQTPLGPVPVDTELQDTIAARAPFVKMDERSHRDEHSIEVQLPFLQRKLRSFTFVPISLAYLDIAECAELGAAIAVACNPENGVGSRTVVLASSDLSHYLSPEETNTLDELALQRVLELDAEGLIHVVRDNGISMCGVLPATVMLYAARALGANQARLLKHCHSGDVAPMGQVVGYASVAIEL